MFRRKASSSKRTHVGAAPAHSKNNQKKESKGSIPSVQKTRTKKSSESTTKSSQSKASNDSVRRVRTITSKSRRDLSESEESTSSERSERNPRTQKSQNERLSKSREKLKSRERSKSDEHRIQEKNKNQDRRKSQRSQDKREKSQYKSQKEKLSKSQDKIQCKSREKSQSKSQDNHCKTREKSQQSREKSQQSRDKCEKESKKLDPSLSSNSNSKDTYNPIEKLLTAGFAIENKGKTYVIYGSKLNTDVYTVKESPTNKPFAMKIQWKKHEKGAKQLKKDVFVLTDAKQQTNEMNRHFAEFQTAGQIMQCFNYVVMTLFGSNLTDFRSLVLKGRDFSKPDAGRLCMQSFQAIHNLHFLGYIHRNIGPSKFVIGLDKPQVLYLIDFSMSYHFEQRFGIATCSSDKRTLPENLTRRTFLSRNYHKHKDLHRKDDLEQWVYLSFNFFDQQSLRWNEKTKDSDMLAAKERLFAGGFEECYKNVPLQYKAIIQTINKLSSFARPDYVLIGTFLEAMKEDLKFDYAGRFEWTKPNNGEQHEEFSEELVLFDERDEKSHMDEIYNKKGATTQEPSGSPYSKEKSEEKDRIAKLHANLPEPRKIEKNLKEVQIEKGAMKGKNDYPTMNDVLSDWETEEQQESKEKKDDEQQKEEKDLLSSTVQK